MWIVYFALAVALLALAILVFYLARRRAAAAREGLSASEYVVIASTFVNVATLAVALVALYVAFQALGQKRGPAGGPGAGTEPRPQTQEAAKSPPPPVTPGGAAKAEPLATPPPALPAPRPAQASAANPPAPAPPAGAAKEIAPKPPAAKPPPAPVTASVAPKTEAAPAPPAAKAPPAPAMANVAPRAAAALPASAAPPPATPAANPLPKAAAPVAPAKALPAGKPDVRLEFEMSARALGVLLVNESGSERASEISCQARLWDLDDPDDDSFSKPLATDCGAAYLGPRGVLGPARLARGPAKQPRVIDKGDRFFGYVTVSCPPCLQTHSYAVYFVLGTNQGWQAAADPNDLLTPEFTRETAEAAAQRFLARRDKLPIRVFRGL